MDTTTGMYPEPVDEVTEPTPLLPEAVLPISQSPHSLALWGRRLGDTGPQLFPIALGTRSFGWSVDAPGAAELIDRFIDLGGNFIDASGSPADNRTEHIVGSWAGRRGRREMMLGTTVGNHHDRAGAPAQAIVGAVEAALTRLAVDRLDLLSIQLGEQSRVDEVLVAVDDLVRSGKVRHVAAASPTADQLVEARVVAAQSGVMPLTAVQGSYSLLHRDGYEPEVAPVATLQGAGFMPRQPLSSGLLTEREHSKQQVARLRRRGLVTSLPPRRWPPLFAALGDIATELGASAAAVALAWLLTRPNVVAPIVSMSSVQEVDDTMAAVRIQLTRQQTADLDRLSA
jgi:aryl-alcohol dehydrogenase-like predicted oxidoreductase